MRGKSIIFALASSVLAAGALAAPAVAGEDELRVFRIDEVRVIPASESGGGEIGPPDEENHVEVEVRYDCRINDERSGEAQRFNVAVVVGQGGTQRDPRVEASAVGRAGCDDSSDTDRRWVEVHPHRPFREFRRDDPLYFDALGVTSTPRTKDFTDFDFRAGTAHADCCPIYPIPTFR